MAKTTGNPNLTVSHQEAEKLLRLQMAVGETIYNLQVYDAQTLKNARAEYDKWFQYNATLLRKIFDSDSVSKGYTYFGIFVSQPNLRDQISDFKDDVRNDINKLDAIIHKSSLYNVVSSDRQKSTAPKTKDGETTYDNLIKWFKNKKLTAVILLLVVMTTGIALVIKNIKETRDNLFGKDGLIKTDTTIVKTNSLKINPDQNIDDISSDTSRNVSLQIEWKTTGDNKDWDSKPTVEIFDSRGRSVGFIDCCSSNSTEDDWQAGKLIKKNISLSVLHLTESDLIHGRLSTGRIPVGNDDWDYSATLYLVKQDSKSIQLASCSGRNSCNVVW